MVLNIATVVPFGLVVFFPSYAFLDQARQVWQASGMIEKRLGARKKVFFEPREGSDIELMLREYAEAARGTGTAGTHAVDGTSFSALNGAILFAVVGGKVSEGLNFTDELARAVVVVGLPFANLGSQELQERMRFVKERATAAAGPAPGPGKDAGVELYENMCMKVCEYFHVSASYYEC
jgi:chromosome transmission fidelity protein 1